MFRILIVALLFASPALAQKRLTPEEFERLSTGHTLYFTQDGQIFGAEEYNEEREVIWRFVGRECVRGNWWAEGENICFAYENSPTPQCWGFFKDDAGYFARGVGADPSEDLRVADSSDFPVPCPGPDTGV